MLLILHQNFYFHISEKANPGNDHWQLQHWPLTPTNIDNWENLIDVKFSKFTGNILSCFFVFLLNSHIFFQFPSPAWTMILVKKPKKNIEHIELLWQVMSLLLPKQHNLDGQHVRCDQPLRLPRSPYQWWWGCVKGGETEVRSVTLSGRCGAPEQTIAWFRRPDSFKLVVRRPHTLRLAPIKINVKIYISSVYIL